jgi:hypothetical protein
VRFPQPYLYHQILTTQHDEDAAITISLKVMTSMIVVKEREREFVPSTGRRDIKPSNGGDLTRQNVPLQPPSAM